MIRQLPTSTASTTNPTATTTTTQSTNSNCNCGIARRETRIVGGIETEAQEYPWQAALVHPGEKAPWCGGSLVSSQHVLTAAHCTHGHTESTIQVLPAEHDTTDSEVDRHNVTTITEHPSFNETTAAFDFSILTLSSPVNTSSVAAPICLPASVSSLYTGDVATVIGWGDTSSGGSQASTLQEANVTIITNEDCVSSYGNRINSSHICATDTTNTGKDTCQKDSGGPIFLLENGRYTNNIYGYGRIKCQIIKYFVIVTETPW